MKIKNKLKLASCAAMLCCATTVQAATVAIGVYDGNDQNAEIFSQITGFDATTELDRAHEVIADDGTVVNTWSDNTLIGAYGDLLITGTTPFDGGGENEYTAGTWEYTGDGSIEWLVVKYDGAFGVYEITEGDTSGTWDLWELEAVSDTDASGTFEKNGELKVATMSHVTAYGISPVPVPAAAWLFATGLLGLVGVARRKG